MANLLPVFFPVFGLPEDSGITDFLERLSAVELSLPWGKPYYYNSDQNIVSAKVRQLRGECV